jgi:hypothetical protein
MPKAPAELTRETAFAAQAKANALLVYKRKESLPAGVAWEGVVDEPGQVRLVALAQGRWYVAVLQADK